MKTNKKYICNLCEKTFNSEKLLNMHFGRYHFPNLPAYEQALHEKQLVTSNLKNIPLDILTKYMEKIKEYNNLKDLFRRQFASFYLLVSKNREFNENTDFDLFLNKVLPWKKANPKIGNSRELCSIIALDNVEAEKLYSSMLNKNPFKGHDASLSPFSKNFIGYKDLSDEDKLLAVEKANNCKASDKSPVQYKYWMKQGYSETEAKEKVTERQKTFSLAICIEKFGEEEGLKVFNARQKKWLSNYNKQNFSNISQKLFWEIYEIIKNDYKNIYFATLKDGIKDESGKNNEYNIKLKKSYVKADFLVKDLRKIIEFDGDYWHGEKRGNQERDRLRDKAIKSMNYEIFHVSEKEYKLNPDNIVKECIKFIKNVF